MTFTWFDALLFGIMFLSAVLALMRGLTREILSLLSWVGGAIAVVLLHPVLRNTARSYFPPEDQLVADIALGVVIFLVFLILIALITMKLSDWLLDSGIGVLDRTLGFIFGALRGLALVVVGYLLFIWAAPRELHPDGMRNARSLQLVETTSEIVIQYLPPEIAETLLSKTYKHGNERNNTEPTQTPPADDDQSIDNDASLTKPPSGTGYNTAQRSSFNQLLQSTQDNQN